MEVKHNGVGSHQPYRWLWPSSFGSCNGGVTKWWKKENDKSYKKKKARRKNSK